ncbi:MAG: TetR family transcriptional regulator [Ruminococcus sp.]
MPKGSEELTNTRKEEIINACAKLYETMSFKDITIKEIGNATSFTRTSIYNYFHTKEEIFLALLKREYDMWNKDLRKMISDKETMTKEEFSSQLAHTLEKRERLLKIMSMNHYDMESSTRMENLVEFKKSYGESLRLVSDCLKKYFPEMTHQEIQSFIYAFFPFLFGVYPYTFVTQKQKDAMDKAGTKYVLFSVYEITYSCIKRLLDN